MLLNLQIGSSNPCQKRGVRLDTQDRCHSIQFRIQKNRKKTSINCCFWHESEVSRLVKTFECIRHLTINRPDLTKFSQKLVPCVIRCWAEAKLRMLSNHLAGRGHRLRKNAFGGTQPIHHRYPSSMLWKMYIYLMILNGDVDVPYSGRLERSLQRHEHFIKGLSEGWNHAVTLMQTV